MKRFGENAAREALANGAKIREYDHLSINAGYRVMIDGEIAGYITFELFVKLLIDKTLSIEGSKRGFDHFEYASAQPETVTDAENAGEGAQTAENEEENTMTPKHKKEARVFCEAIEKIAQKPQNLENLESYLSYHFAEWIEKYANAPENIAAELKQFAEMEL